MSRTALGQCKIRDEDLDELRERVMADAKRYGTGGTLLTPEKYDEISTVQPIIEAAAELIEKHFGDAVVVERAWGVRICPGVTVPEHDHINQKYTAVFYLTPGVSLIVEGCEIEVEPGVLVAFPGDATHWTRQHLVGDRLSIAIAFK